jgi:hypothetical protein
VSRGPGRAGAVDMSPGAGMDYAWRPDRRLPVSLRSARFAAPRLRRSTAHGRRHGPHGASASRFAALDVSAAPPGGNAGAKRRHGRIFLARFDDESCAPRSEAERRSPGGVSRLPRRRSRHVAVRRSAAKPHQDDAKRLRPEATTMSGGAAEPRSRESGRAQRGRESPVGPPPVFLRALCFTFSELTG